MGSEANRIQRSLVIHPEESTRRAIRRAIRRALERVGSYSATVYEAGSLTEGFQSIRLLDPHVVLLDLTEERALALRIAGQARRPGRLIIGLYNPLLMQERLEDFFREAIRAGIGDFVPLPVAEDELVAALGAAMSDSGQESAPATGRLVSFISAKGGVGTTTLAVNLALVLAESELIEEGVALCDAAIRFGTAAAYLGFVPDRDLADLARDLDDVGALSTYLVRHPQTRLDVLASPRDPRAAQQIAPADMSAVLIHLCRSFGLVVVDCPPGLDLLNLAVLDLSESIFVVTEAITPAVLATATFLELLDDQGLGERVRVIVNRHSSIDGVLTGRMVHEQLGRPVDYVFLDEKAVVTAASRGNPIVLSRPKAEFSKAMDFFAQSLVLTEGATEQDPESED